MQFIRRAVLIVPVMGAALFSAASATPAVTAAPAAADTTMITVRASTSTLAFNPDVITVKAGATVHVRFINESVFSHNMVVLKSEDDIDPVGTASFDAHDTGFVPAQYKERYIAYSPLAGAGKTVDFTFTAPAAGEYPFACFVDGHFNMMVGTLKVVN